MTSTQRRIRSTPPQQKVPGRLSQSVISRLFKLSVEPEHVDRFCPLQLFRVIPLGCRVPVQLSLVGKAEGPGGPTPHSRPLPWSSS